MTDNRDAGGHPPAGLRPALTEWDITVTMARRSDPDEPVELRTFTTTMPAVDHTHAQRGGIEYGLAINTASRYEWKLNDDPDGPLAVPHVDQATAPTGGN